MDAIGAFRAERYCQRFLLSKTGEESGLVSGIVAGMNSGIQSGIIARWNPAIESG